MNPGCPTGERRWSDSQVLPGLEACCQVPDFFSVLNHPKTIYLGRVNLDVALQDEAAWRFQTIPCLPPSTGLISLCKAFCESVASFFAQNMEKSIYSPPNWKSVCVLSTKAMLGVNFFSRGPQIWVYVLVLYGINMLVGANINFSIYWELHHPNWLSLIFFRGLAQPTTNQIWSSPCINLIMNLLYDY